MAAAWTRRTASGREAAGDTRRLQVLGGTPGRASMMIAPKARDESVLPVPAAVSQAARRPGEAV